MISNKVQVLEMNYTLQYKCVWYSAYKNKETNVFA